MGGFGAPRCVPYQEAQIGEIVAVEEQVRAWRQLLYKAVVNEPRVATALEFVVRKKRCEGLARIGRRCGWWRDGWRGQWRGRRRGRRRRGWIRRWNWRSIRLCRPGGGAGEELVDCP